MEDGGAQLTLVVYRLPASASACDQHGVDARRVRLGVWRLWEWRQTVSRTLRRSASASCMRLQLPYERAGIALRLPAAHCNDTRQRGTHARL